jgi:hypothetical protein
LPEQRKRRVPKASADVANAQQNGSSQTAESFLNENVAPSGANVESAMQVSRVDDLAQAMPTRDGDAFGEVF